MTKWCVISTDYPQLIHLLPQLLLCKKTSELWIWTNKNDPLSPSSLHCLNDLNPQDEDVIVDFSQLNKLWVSPLIELKALHTACLVD